MLPDRDAAASVVVGTAVGDKEGVEDGSDVGLIVGVSVGVAVAAVVQEVDPVLDVSPTGHGPSQAEDVSPKRVP